MSPKPFLLTALIAFLWTFATGQTFLPAVLFAPATVKGQYNPVKLYTPVAGLWDHQPKVILVPGEGHGPIDLRLPFRYDTLSCFADEDSASLYQKIRAGKTIKNAFIEVLDLSHLGNSKRITYSLLFDHCIIREIEYGDDLTTDSLHFTRPVSFKQCFIHSFETSHSRFDSAFALITCNSYTFTITASTFFGPFYLFNAKNDELDRSVPDTLPIVFKEFFQHPPLFRFSGGCSFYNRTFIYNTNPYKEFDFSYNSFFAPVQICWYNNPLNPFFTYCHHKIPALPVYDPTSVKAVLPSGSQRLRNALHPTRSLTNLDFTKSTFAASVDFERSSLWHCSFRATTFLDTLIFYNTEIATVNPVQAWIGRQSILASSFSDILVPNENTTAIVNPELFNLDSLGLDATALLHTDWTFPRKPGARLTNTQLLHYQTFLSQTENLCTSTIHNDKTAVNEITGHLEHEKLKYKMDYLRDHPSASNTTSYLGYQLLEWTVGNGYHGEGRFTLSCICWIFAFAILYYWRFRKEVTYYVDRIRNSGEQINIPPARKYRTPLQQKWAVFTDRIVTFIKCVWVSFLFFITPRFSVTYFKFSSGLLLLVILEWLLGVVMIALFLIYIASQYPFVKSIIGMG